MGGQGQQRPARRLKRLTQIVLDEAARLIPVRDGDRTVTLSMQQAIIRRLTIDAAKGDPRAQRLFTEILTLSEDEAPRTTEQASRRTMEIVIVDPQDHQADDDAEEGS